MYTITNECTGKTGSSDTLLSLISNVMTDDYYEQRLSELYWISNNGNNKTTIKAPYFDDVNIGKLLVVYAKYIGTYGQLKMQILNDIIDEVLDVFDHSDEVSICHGKFTITKE